MARRLSREEIARRKRLEQLEKELRAILLNAFTLSIRISAIQNAMRNLTDDFSVIRNRPVMRKINTILKDHFSKFQVKVINAVSREFEISAADSKKTFDKIPAKTTQEITVLNEIKAEATRQVRDIAKESSKFVSEKKGGRTISERVWKNFENIPKELETLVQNNIKEGKPAEYLAKNIEKYLIEPERIFRRVRNPKTGKLEWTKAAQNFKPGQGVYRSSFKNAMRLARTEINRAYREAEWNGFQNNQNVYGFEIVLSNNTENQCDTCKRLAGVYPKWFKWTGWHPQCRCRMIAVLMPREDFAELVRLRFQGKEKEFKPQFIDKLPDQFVSYIQENSDRISKAASVPYWYEDNRERIISLNK